MPEIELLFLGTGTSAGVPMIGCKCPVCNSPDPCDQRDRSSVVISYEKLRVLVDTTPELRVQCLRHQVEMIDAVVYTHAHADHIFGLDDVRRFNSLRQGPLDVWADAETFKTLNGCFGYAFRDVSTADFRPRLVHRLIGGPFEIGGMTWTPITFQHGGHPVLGFRVGGLAYCTDVNFIPEESFALLKGLDVLVLDALAHQPHEKHFSLSQAVEAAQRIDAKQTLFTHIGHTLPHAATNRTLPKNMRLAHDGERVRVSMGSAAAPRSS